MLTSWVPHPWSRGGTPCAGGLGLAGQSPQSPPSVFSPEQKEPPKEAEPVVAAEPEAPENNGNNSWPRDDTKIASGTPNPKLAASNQEIPSAGQQGVHTLFFVSEVGGAWLGLLSQQDHPVLPTSEPGTRGQGFMGWG
ncbi:hypothetical protein P7K49_021693 [Saguinus oedipus]|uniref:Uncharacterized protein n=1 Tax=Saguinus oedipus TaxID=9490 RepID=A0ABQ9UU53_SAGOE|nr:hypothetical protein P7K49_021693 [Saguinus oedipus]